MGQRIAGHFNGKAQDRFICIGFVPDWVKVRNLEGTVYIETVWDRYMAKCTERVGGVSFTGTGTGAAETIGLGIQPYWGGDLMTTTNQTNVTYGDGIYIERDDKDYRYYTNAAAGISGDASSATIDTWTLNTAAAMDGKFNSASTGTYIGEGSTIIIDVGSHKQQYVVNIVTCAAAAGTTAGDVVLSYPVPTGKVRFIGGMLGYKPVPIGNVTKPGFWIDLAAATSTLTAANELVMFEAGTYDSPKS